MSSTIYIIRHGDKPTAKDQKPYGVKDSGEADYRSLLVKGWQRAGCWASYFLPPSGTPFAGVAADNLYVYASARDKHDKDSDPSDSTGEVDGSKSRRPVETVTPLAALLQPSTEPDATYTKGEEVDVAHAAMEQKLANAVICWQHENIHHIVNAVKKHTIADGDLWRSDCFNGVVVLTHGEGGWTATQSAPLQLDGDTTAGPYSAIATGEA